MGTAHLGAADCLQEKSLSEGRVLGGFAETAEESWKTDLSFHAPLSNFGTVHPSGKNTLGPVVDCDATDKVGAFSASTQDVHLFDKFLGKSQLL